MMPLEERQRPVAPAALRDALLDARDPEAAVQALSPLEFSHLVLAVGREDALELLAAASAEQLKVLIDLEAWRGDRPDRDRLLAWLEPFEEAGPGRLARAFLALDAELAALLLLEEIRVYLAEEDEDPGEGHELLPTPDRRVFFEILPTDAERAELLKNLLDAMFRRDPSASVRALLEIRAALPAELEEQSVRWRNARLGDLGFPDLEDALALYARPGNVPPEQAARSEAVSVGGAVQVPVLYRDVLSGGRLVPAALAAAPEDRRDELTGALVLLLNQVLVAERVELADAGGIRKATAGARDLLELGLEQCHAASAEPAAALLLDRGPREIFREGHALTAELARRARALVRDGLASGDPPGSLLDPPGGEVLAGLLGQARPRMSCLLDEPPAHGARSFASLRDVELTAAALDRAEAAGLLVHRLLGMPGKALRAIARDCGQSATLGNAFRTAAVRRVLGAESFTIEELSGAELIAFRQRAIRDTEPATLDPALAEQIHEGLQELIARLPERLQDPAREAIRGWLQALVEELGAIPREDEVDPRFVGSFLVRP